MLVSPKKYNPILISTLIAILIFFFSYDFGMFWDNVLFASKMGNQLYENGLFNWNMPIEFDPGHPPFLAFLLAIAWKIFGHSLWVSHLVMLPFVAGTIYQIHRFVFFYTKSNLASIAGLVLILCDPTLLTSFVLVNPETLILFFFFLTLNGFLYEQKRLKFIGLLFLSIITFRSMMLFAGFFVFETLNSYLIKKRSIKKLINLKFLVFYFLASLPAIAFISWRLLTKGWLQTHPDSPWTSYWHLPSIKEFIRNVIVLIWRYLDFGRIFIFIFLLIGLWYRKKNGKLNNAIRQLLLMAFTSVFFVLIAVLSSTNAFGHRYFIVAYVCFILIAYLIIQDIPKYRKLIYASLMIGLLSGNLWIYPEKISQGWDATLAHVPYHQLRTEAIEFLDKESIHIEQVGTFFPNYNSIDQIDLNGDHRKFDRFNDDNSYVLYSNVYNITDEQYDSLQRDYQEIKRFESFNIYISILKKK